MKTEQKKVVIELINILQIMNAAYMNETHINMKKMSDYLYSYNKLKMLLSVSGNVINYRDVDKSIAQFLGVRATDSKCFRLLRNDVAHLYDFNNPDDEVESYYKNDNIKYMRYNHIYRVNRIIKMIRRYLNENKITWKRYKKNLK